MTDDRAVLFDMDGVLVQTEALKARAHTAAVEHVGGRVPDGFYPTVMGRSHQAVRGAFLAAAGLRVLALRHAFNGGQDFSWAVAVLDDLANTCAMGRMMQDLLGQ